jgi:hypothetical protein
MAVNTMIESCLRDFVPECCHRSESSTDYPAPLFCVEFIPGRLHWSQPRLAFPMYVEEYIRTLLMSNITIELFIRKAPTLTQLWSD